MKESNEFDGFYSKYLGLCNAYEAYGCLACPCDNRDIPLNKHYYYKVLITDYNNQRIVSCSPSFQKGEVEEICKSIGGKQFEDIAKEGIFIEGYHGGCMCRLILGESTNTERAGFEEDGAFWTAANGEKITFLYLREMRKFLAISGEKLAGYSKISDVYEGYGNVVVWVDEEYRRQGIAAILVEKTIGQCKKDGISPMYIVRSDNAASIALAKKLGFQMVQKEYIMMEDEKSEE